MFSAIISRIYFSDFNFIYFKVKMDPQGKVIKKSKRIETRRTVRTAALE